jgi:hypothetical protein
VLLTPLRVLTCGAVERGEPIQGLFHSTSRESCLQDAPPAGSRQWLWPRAAAVEPGARTAACARRTGAVGQRWQGTRGNCGCNGARRTPRNEDSSFNSWKKAWGAFQARAGAPTHAGQPQARARAPAPGGGGEGLGVAVQSTALPRAGCRQDKAAERERAPPAQRGHTSEGLAFDGSVSDTALSSRGGTNTCGGWAAGGPT